MKKLATVLIILFATTTAVFACSCKRALIFGDVKRADVIFSGVVQNLEQKYLVETYEYQSRIIYDTTFYYEFEFIIKRPYKGSFLKDESIKIKSGGSTCSLYFEKGSKYLVYTSEVNYHFNIMENTRIESYYDGDYCSGTKRSKKTWPQEWMILFLSRIF